ncbi:MAG: helix-turn-helix transcriptional regulator [Clostridiales bacterium]|nr:helix-turn-helix transcriptional regulator [Clostridiales bacterium]
MEFKNRCLQVRLRLNLSQEMLAQKLGVSFATVNRWENGKSVPSKLTTYRFEKFCKENNVTIE